MKLAASLVAAAVFVSVVSSSAHAYSVTAKGRVLYNDAGTSKGLAGARIHVWDSDTDWDDSIAVGYTDGSGYFNLSGSADDNWLFCSGCKPDVYVEVELESAGGRVVVESEILKTNYSADTGVRANTSGTVDFGTFSFASAEGKLAQALFAKTRQAYAQFTKGTGIADIPRHGGKAAVLFPSSVAAGVPWTTEESIHWPGGYNSPNTIFHEFGHRLRHAQDGDFGHFLVDVAKYTYPQHHYNTKVTNDGFAFNEGWADFHRALLIQSEMDRYTTWKPVNNNANNVEGNVAAKLLALYKRCGASFGRMWSVLRANAGAIHSYSSFEAKMRAKYPTCFAGSALPPEASPTAVVADAGARGALPGFAAALSDGAPTPVVVSPAAVRDSLANIARAADVRLRLLATPDVRAARRPLPPGLAKKSADFLKRFRLARARRDAAWLQASHGLLSAFIQGVAPVDPAKNVKALLQGREAARGALFRKLFEARQRQLTEVYQEAARELAATTDPAQRRYLIYFQSRVQGRLATLRTALLRGDSSSLRLLMPRTYRLSTQ